MPAKDERRPQLTLRDVSEASGVSEMTVSRVLRNRGDVSAKTRLKVQEAARALGYVPNKIAGALASNRVNLVGVVVPSLSNMVFPDLLAGVNAGLEGTELQPVVGATFYDQEKEEKVLYELLSWRPSGIIIAGLEHSEASKNMLANAGIPVVEVMDVDGEPIDMAVGISHWRAGYEMGREILARGYRKIGFLTTKTHGDHRARKRLEGLERALAEGGAKLHDQSTYEGSSGFAPGRDLTHEMLTRSPDIDCLYYSNDMTAAGGLLYCLEHGYDIGNQLGLAGFNGFDLLKGLPRKIATTDSCRHETGLRAAKLISQSSQITSDENAKIELSPTIITGDTLRAKR